MERGTPSASGCGEGVDQHDSGSIRHQDTGGRELLQGQLCLMFVAMLWGSYAPALRYSPCAAQASNIAIPRKFQNISKPFCKALACVYSRLVCQAESREVISASLGQQESTVAAQQHVMVRPHAAVLRW
jgi:hypothetical protein